MSNCVDNSQIMKYSSLATTTGAVVDLSDIDVCSFQVVSTAQSGSNVIALYESVDGTNFVAVSGVTVTITTLNTDTVWHLNPVYSRYYKVLFTAGSGATTFNVTLNARNNTAQGLGAYVVPPVSITAS
jgi:hypothetical protein